MRLLRRVSQIFFITIFFILFLFTIYPLNDAIPVSLFLEYDPLLAISVSLAARRILLKTLPAFILLALSLLLGRFFCGWICPMGSAIDAADAGIHGPYGSTKKNWRWVKFAILAAILTGSLFSVQLAGYADPLALFTRSTVACLYPLFVFITDGMLGLLMSIPFLEEGVYRLYEGLRGNVMPVFSTAFRGSVVIAFILIGMVLFGVVHRRFWCRNLCPLGALFGLVSGVRRYRREVTEECTSCGLCRKKCRMDAIGKDFISTNHTECISCMDCQGVCPVNAIRFRFPKKARPSAPDFSRRQFITAGSAGLFLAGMTGIGFLDPREKSLLIRPPGALQENAFLDRCVRCGECIRVCSTAGAGLHFSGIEAGLQALWTPALQPKTGYCEYNCALCGQVCPTGAIQPLTLEAKKEARIGTAHFDKSRCIPWYYGEDCLVCEEHCPLPEKAIKFRTSRVTALNGKETIVQQPYVDESLCIGCGICVTRCPVEGERGIFLTNAQEMRL